MPLFIAGSTFALLAIVYIPYLLLKQGFHLKGAWWIYAIYAIIESCGQYFCIISLEYTNVSSWTLMAALTIWIAIPLSMKLLKAQYRFGHFIFAFVILAGLVLLIFSDANGINYLTGKLGDFVTFVGFAFFSIAHIVTEYLIKRYKTLRVVRDDGCFWMYSNVSFISYSGRIVIRCLFEL